MYKRGDIIKITLILTPFVIAALLITSFVAYAVYTDTIYLTLNPKDNTCTLFIHGISIKGTYDQTDTDYTIYPSLGFMNCPIGPTLRVLQNEYVVDQTFGVLKLKYEPSQRIRNGRRITDPTGIIKFSPMKD